MKFRSIHKYVIGICALAIAALFVLNWPLLLEFPPHAIVGLLALIALSFLSEFLALSVTIAKSSGHSSIIFIPLLACQLLFGPAATVAVVLLVYTTAELVIRKKGLFRAAFNIAQLTVAVTVAGVVSEAVGGVPLALPVGSDSSLVSQLVPFGAFTIVFLGLNHTAVTTAIAFDQELPFQKVWRNRAGRSGANSLYDILVSPVAIVVAFLFLELGFVGILISLLPLLFIRHAYLTNYRLQQANRDLLKALVKAIETRDPYTSGHSLRVSKLARRIANEMGVSRKVAEAVETGALLHDVGKIDAVYTEILSKPTRLTQEERRVIQSHVAKGVELLQSLSSFGKRVIEAVRHHHERIDGNGYPDGLKGGNIPLAARIIKVCDAIDAMLSDRPYRDALSLSDVRHQLLTHKNSQFDPEIVEYVVDSTILEEHKKELEMYKNARFSTTNLKRRYPLTRTEESRSVT